MPKVVRATKRPITVTATLWETHGDHPGVEEYRPSGHHNCRICGIDYRDHGWIDHLEGKYMVCPGDWIIEGVKGELYPCKPDVFALTYEIQEADRAEQEEVTNAD